MLVSQLKLSESQQIDKSSKAFPFKRTGELRTKSSQWAPAMWCGFITNSTKESNIARATFFVKMSTKERKKITQKKKIEGSLKSWIF